MQDSTEPWIIVLMDRSVRVSTGAGEKRYVIGRAYSTISQEPEGHIPEGLANSFLLNGSAHVPTAEESSAILGENLPTRRGPKPNWRSPSITRIKEMV